MPAGITVLDCHAGPTESRAKLFEFLGLRRGDRDRGQPDAVIRHVGCRMRVDMIPLHQQGRGSVMGDGAIIADGKFPCQVPPRERQGFAEVKAKLCRFG